MRHVTSALCAIACRIGCREWQVGNGAVPQAPSRFPLATRAVRFRCDHVQYAWEWRWPATYVVIHGAPLVACPHAVGTRACIVWHTNLQRSDMSGRNVGRAVRVVRHHPHLSQDAAVVMLVGVVAWARATSATLSTRLDVRDAECYTPVEPILMR